MLFSTVEFFLFLAVALASFYASPPRGRRWILLAASYFFYASWNWRFIPLLLALTAIDYAAALWMVRLADNRRKLALVVSLAANIGFLGFFKYYNFFASNVAGLLGRPSQAFFVNIVLPLGISFHTFQSMAYVIDVYRREQEPIRSPVDYAVFISFFPQLVAGPIVRAHQFFRDFFGWRAPTGQDVQGGILLVMLGLTKKMALADPFAQVSDAYFASVGAHPGWIPAWSGVFAFGMQVYFDFSGYSDMAIGMARLLGFHFPINFRRPYLADSITEYWRRWHLTLSRWLRDYVYIPLGGNRRGRLIQYRNLFLTMLLCGFWHGADWNRVLWGGYQGLLMVAERLPDGKAPQFRPRSPLFPLRWLWAFGMTLVGYALFRASSLADAGTVLREMFTGAAGAQILKAWHWGLVGLALLAAVFEERHEWFDRLERGPQWAYAGVLVALFLCLEVFAVTEAQIPFVYFQF